MAKFKVSPESVFTNTFLFFFPYVEEYLRETKEPIILVKIECIQELYSMGIGDVIEVVGDECVLDLLSFYRNYKGQASITMNGHTSYRGLTSSSIGFFKNKTLEQIMKEAKEWKEKKSES